MVASNFFGRSNSLEMIWNALGFSSKPLSISVRVKEKNATSAPEISAEHNKRMASNNIPETNDVFTDKKNRVKLEGSGSKVKVFG